MALAATALAFASTAQAIGCKNEQGQPVDWWAAFKFSNSYNYAYIDADSYNGLQESEYDLSSSSSGAPAHTLSQLYGGADSYAFYNDEPPNGAKASSTYGHTKGAMGFDSNSGFWLIHSVPRFPDNTASSYPGLPANEVKYGQSFLCVSYDVDTFNDIGSLLQENRPKFYATELASSASSSLPNLAAAFSGTYDHSANLINKNLRSSGGMSFTLFAKTHTWVRAAAAGAGLRFPSHVAIFFQGLDLYNQGVSAYFEDDTYVESWMNGVWRAPKASRSAGPCSSSRALSHCCRRWTAADLLQAAVRLRHL